MKWFKKASVMAGIAAALALNLVVTPVAQADPSKAPSLALAAEAIAGEVGVSGGLTPTVMSAHFAAVGTTGGSVSVTGTTAAAAATAAEANAGAVALAGSAGVTAASTGCWVFCNSNTFDWLTNLIPYDVPMGDVSTHLPPTYAPTDQLVNRDYMSADVINVPGAYLLKARWKPETIRLENQNTTLRIDIRFFDGYRPNGDVYQYVGFWSSTKCTMLRDTPELGGRPAYTKGTTWWTPPQASTVDVWMDGWGSSFGKGGCITGPDGKGNGFNLQPGDYQPVGLKLTDVKAPGDNTAVLGSNNGAYPTNWIQWEKQAGAPVSPEGVTYQIRQECVAANGTVTELLGATSTGLDDDIDYPSCVASGKGTYAKKAELIYDNHAGTKESIWTVTPSVPSQYSQCDPSLNGGTLCKLSVSIDGKECVMGDAKCKIWTQLRQINPGSVKCMWGPYAVASAQCNKLERAYGDEPAQRNDKNVDGNPNTGGFTYYVNPVRNADGTQTQVVKPTTEAPSPTPESGGFPSTGTNPSYGNSNCIGSGWSWNPVSWVATPVQCALQSAFTPNQTTLQNARTQLESKLKAKGIQNYTNSLNVLVGGIGDFAGASVAGGCKGPPMPFDLDFGPTMQVHKVFYPLDACVQPVKMIADVSRTLITFVVGVAGAFAVVRSVSRAFGYDFSMGVRGDG
jgi:hypothetical protein